MSIHYTGLEFAVEPEAIIQTHCSIVLLHEQRVYKLKKPVKFPFLDYSTLALRLRFCLAEVLLNRRFSPEIYLGVAEVRRNGDRLEFGEPVAEPAQGDEIVDYAVVMQRIPNGAWLNQIVARGEVTPESIRLLIELLIASWRALPADDEVRANGLPQSLRHNTVANIAECERFVPGCLSREAWGRLDALLRGWFDRHPEVFEQRVKQDRIRDGHGDLKPGNVAFVKGRPVVTDCIEFNPLFRRLDTLCEVAFLATGLESLGDFSSGAAVLAAYREAADDDYPPMLRRYYQAHLSCVMGKVTALQLEAGEIEAERKTRLNALAKHYFALADFHAREPHVVVVAGIMGCGKSTVALALARHFGWPVVSSDVVRKQIAGVAATERLPEAAYSDEMSQRVYEKLLEAAGAKGGAAGVILDGQFPTRQWRESARRAAEAAGGTFTFVLCDAPDDVVRERLRKRESEPDRVSDATEGLLQRARERFQPVEELPVIAHDTREPPELLVSRVQAALLGESFNPAAAM